MTHLDQIESRLKEIDERCAAATLGPWHTSAGTSIIQTAHITRDVWQIADVGSNSQSTKWGDQKFIAHSRTDLPAVVKALRVMTEASKKILDDEWRPNTEDTLEQALSAIASILGGEK